MNLFKYFIIVSLLITNATQAATGCVANSNNSLIYLQMSGPNYRANGTTAPLGTGCKWIFIGGTCTINGGIGAGLKAQDAPQDCDIDTNILLMLVGCIGFGVYRIYRNQININIPES